MHCHTTKWCLWNFFVSVENESLTLEDEQVHLSPKVKPKIVRNNSFIRRLSRNNSFLAKKESKFNQIMNELLNTEKSYLKQLKSLKNDIIEPILNGNFIYNHAITYQIYWTRNIILKK